MSTNPHNKSRVLDVLKALQAGPKHAADIALAIGIPACTVRRHLAALHKSYDIHITDWLQLNDGPPMRVFALGFGIDAPNPFVAEDRRSGTDRRSSLTTRNVEREFDNKVARNEARRWADKAAAGLSTDPMIAALFGRVQPQEKESA